MFLSRDRGYAVMDKYGLDVLVATTPANVTYMSDFRALGHDLLGSFIFVVFPREGDASIILTRGESADLISLKMTWIKDVRTYGTFYLTIPDKPLSGASALLAEALRGEVITDSFKLLRDVLDEKGLGGGKKIGLDEKYFGAADYARLLKSLEGLDVVPAFDVFREIRMVKTPDQIAALAEANRITEEGIRAVLESVRVGTTGREIWKTYIDTITGLGATCVSPSIALGVDSYLQNMFVPSPRRLERGDLIRFDVGVLYRFHFTDLGRNAVVGEPSSLQKKYYNVVYSGEEAALQSLRPGIKASEVFRQGVEGARNAGMPSFKRHHCGHGIGLELYESPLIAPSNETPLEEGAVINIETPYYEIDAGGFMVEDTVVVRRSGPEFLSKSDRGLYVIPA